MAEAHSEAQWNHTASLMALLFNLNRGKDVPARSPWDFHPHKRRVEKVVRRMNLEGLAALMTR